jgi:anti-sigma regulatory factor (Ser/Thr protein kinase)
MRPEQAAPQNLEPSAAAEPVGAHSEPEGLRAARERHRAPHAAPAPPDDGARARQACALPLDMQAPAGARSAVTGFLDDRVPAAVLDSARLVVSELVTNSVRHCGVCDGVVVVGIELTATMVRLEVADPGRAGVIRPRRPDRVGGGGFGLHLVQSLSERWGLERASGGTRVWAQLLRIPQASGGDMPHEPEERMP